MDKLFIPPQGEADHHAYHSRFEKKLDKLLVNFEDFTHGQIITSALLLFATISALFAATMPYTKHLYQFVVHLPLGVNVGHLEFTRPLIFWVNDILLTLFFFFVGLEIKREFLVGELTHKKRTYFITACALGGMLVPAGIYYLINLGLPTQVGWGIPMATDTAFAIGLLSCFRNRLSTGVFTFLTAMAVLDDIGAIIVIAVFYSENFELSYLLTSGPFIALLVLFNVFGLRRPLPYFIVGLIIWVLIEHAGIHGTLAGIIIAFTIPSRPRKGPRRFIEETKTLVNEFEARKKELPLVLEDKDQHELIEEVKEAAIEATTPLQRWERKLELPILFLVLPLFAFVNAGIPLSMDKLVSIFESRFTLGIMSGLVIGKPLGITIFGYIAYKLGWGELPKETGFKEIVGVSMLAGIGFTMSIFITNLAFRGAESQIAASTFAIMVGSVMASLLAVVWMIIFHRPVNALN